MAFTAFHCAIVWPLFILKPKKFDFIGLSMGAVIPDLFLPFTIIIFPDYYWNVRIATHSLIGALTLDLLLAAIAAFYVVPAIIGFLKTRSKDPKWYTFAGVDVINSRPNKVVIAYSIIIGSISHVTLDLFYHRGNPLLYPYEPFEILLFDNLALTVFIFNIFIIFGFIAMAYFHWFKKIASQKA